MTLTNLVYIRNSCYTKIEKGMIDMKQYSAEFKLDTVKRHLASGRPFTKIAEKLGINQQHYTDGLGNSKSLLIYPSR